MLAALLEVCIRQRFLAILATAVMAAIGVHAFINTPIEAFPDVTNLQINVISQLPGRAPPEVERQVTIPLERVLNGTPGLIRMRSESLFGLSLIYLTFDDNVESFRARVLVEERMGTADLPDGVLPELGPDATPLGEIFHYRVVGPHSLHELRSQEEWVIAPRLRRVPGVADVVGRGGFLSELHVEPDPARLDAWNITLDDIESAVHEGTRNAGGGFLRSGEQQFVVRGVGSYEAARDLEGVLVAQRDGLPVTLGDVARVTWSYVPRQGATGYGAGGENVEGVVLMRRGENPSRVLDGIHAALDDLKRSGLDEGVEIIPFYDRGTLIAKTLLTVRHSLLEGALLCVGLVWLFLRTLRGSLIVGTVIPLALLVAFAGLYAIGLPANLISMGAIDFGILVDGAVILIENVVHRMQEHPPEDEESRLRLIRNAAIEVARPTFFAMAVILAALTPVFALERVEGRIFRPLALTYSFALIGALVFALTWVPALAALLLKVKVQPQNKVNAEHVPGAFDRVRAGVASIVQRGVNRPYAFFGVTAVMFACAVLGVSRIGTEFLPELDEGDFTVFAELPPSASLEEGQQIFREIRRRLLELPEVRETDTKQGRPEDGTDNESVNMGETYVHLLPKDRWRHGVTTETLEGEIRARLDEIPGIRYGISQPIRDNIEESISGVRGQVVLKVFGDDLEQMRNYLLQALSAVRRVPGVVDAGLYRDRSVPQMEIRPNRANLAQAGLSMSAFQRFLETALAGRQVSELWSGERVIPVRVRTPMEHRSNGTDIGELRVQSPTGVGIPLRTLATTQTAPGRASIVREQNRRMLALKFNVEGRDLGGAVADAIRAVDASAQKPSTITSEWGGEFENQQRASKRLAVVIPISLVLVVTLLYVALNSMRSALITMLMVPFAASGGVFLLLITGVHLSVSAMIGFIALVGQVALACLLVVGTADDYVRQGIARAKAAVDAVALRLRAVVMTTLLAILGLTPMALSTGMGSETQRPFALVLIGGMITTSLIVTFVLPLVYARLGNKPEVA